ncbi:hypothetical protein [Mesorhizobium sp. M00.F.Ca.ET.216.01.1.1]|uniref:hypothetical protein n=1 Tax=Mesorhizobium sp. M00.F.Ca.ET.216.01.1.1 TaxID=2500528 RepID=UPI000FD87B0D|nr:hypothetical protein [Mesorhizobium sp. M00.F.Ca.ET.216.01.1.1]TGQ28826.1 hypothetical protein EN859_033990 [Mesorhizobium sp. M00.F.Ca.ET.216.01.1.1]
MERSADIAPPQTAPGAEARFPYDRAAVERFREAFPRARWSDELGSWFVPGKTAARRIERWLAQEGASRSAHDDSKGRDAFAFDPLSSPYLEVADDLRIRTPYSKTVLEELRAIPWARWDEQLRAWRVPFRSYETLRHHWPRIERAARRAEPEERKRGREANKDSDEHRAAKLRYAERKRHRYPLPAEDLPPLGRAVATEQYGIVVFREISGEVADAADSAMFYPHLMEATVDYLWARWRPATLAELIKTWPARRVAGSTERSRGWWQPTLGELRIARQRARSLERRKRRKVQS